MKDLTPEDILDAIPENDNRIVWDEFYRKILILCGGGFHPDDDVSDLGHNEFKPGTHQSVWIPLFTNAQAKKVNAAVGRMFEIYDDVYQTGLGFMREIFKD